MDVKPCDGWVHTLSEQTLCLTGKVLMDGEWVIRKDCEEMIQQFGANSKPDFSRKITVVVHGDLASQLVTDSHREYSKNLVLATREREQGHHVCVVDGNGFVDLIDGNPAPCRELQRAQGADDGVFVLARSGDEILGGPLHQRKVGQHGTGALSLDLDHLDRGTRTHEATIAALIEHLAHQQVEVRGHARNAPRFDAGWSRDDDIFIAEVKSLTGASEDQQIRLGIGQVLDYTHQLQLGRADSRVCPVLALEKWPTEPRWTSLTEASGILLTWAPGFAGC